MLPTQMRVTKKYVRVAAMRKRTVVMERLKLYSNREQTFIKVDRT